MKYKIILSMFMFVLFSSIVNANISNSYMIDIVPSIMSVNPYNDNLEYTIMFTLDYTADEYDGLYTVTEWGEYEWDEIGVAEYQIKSPLKVYWTGMDCGCDGTYDYSEYNNIGYVGKVATCDYAINDCNTDTYEVCIDVVSVIDGYIGQELDEDERYFAEYWRKKNQILTFNDILNKGSFKDNCNTGFCWVNLIHKVDNSKLVELYPEVCDDVVVEPQPLPPSGGDNNINPNGTEYNPDDPNFPAEGGDRPDDDEQDQQEELEEVMKEVGRTGAVFDGFLSFVALTFSFLLLIFYVVSFIVVIYIFAVIIPDMFRKIRDLIRKSGKIE